MGARLVTIPISHFCEKARWALDRAGVAYVEQPHLQVIHIAAARLAGGGSTVPVFVTAGGEVLPESAAIVRWADSQLPPERWLYPAGPLGEETAALERRLDDGLGPDGRLWLYHETLPALDQMRAFVLAGVPRWERAAFDLSGKAIDVVIRRHFRIDAATAAAALARVDDVFDEVAERLEDGRRFLLGDRFAAADLAFAALSAPLLLPPAYGSPLPAPDGMPEGLMREVRRLRAHPAGRFADRIYAEDRT